MKCCAIHDTAQGRRAAGRMFVAPNLAAVVVFMLFPLGFSLYMSFQKWDLFTHATFVRLDNFRNLFTSDPLFLIAVVNTAVYTVGTVVPTVIVSLVVAAFLNRKIKGISLFRTVVFLPLAISSVVMAVVWQFVFNTDNGLLNIMLGWLGIGPIPWLIEPRWAMVSLCLVSVWRSVPFATVVLLAAMQGVPETVYEAARIDGAGEIRQFVSITVPLIRGHCHSWLSYRSSTRSRRLTLSTSLPVPTVVPRRLPMFWASCCSSTRFRSWNSAMRPRWRG